MADTVAGTKRDFVERKSSAFSAAHDLKAAEGQDLSNRGVEKRRCTLGRYCGTRVGCARGAELTRIRETFNIEATLKRAVKSSSTH